jgi:hypothetical protein
MPMPLHYPLANILRLFLCIQSEFQGGRSHFVFYIDWNLYFLTNEQHFDYPRFDMRASPSIFFFLVFLMVNC